MIFRRPPKKPSVIVSVTNTQLRSRSVVCCLSIASSHFFLPTYVSTQSCKEYPFLPKWMMVMENPCLLSGRGGTCVPDDVFDAAEGRVMSLDRPAESFPELYDSSGVTITKSSKGIGYSQESLLPTCTQRTLRYTRSCSPFARCFGLTNKKAWSNKKPMRSAISSRLPPRRFSGPL